MKRKTIRFDLAEPEVIDELREKMPASVNSVWIGNIGIGIPYDEIDAVTEYLDTKDIPYYIEEFNAVQQAVELYFSQPASLMLPVKILDVIVMEDEHEENAVNVFGGEYHIGKIVKKKRGFLFYSTSDIYSQSFAKGIWNAAGRLMLTEDQLAEFENIAVINIDDFDIDFSDLQSVTASLDEKEEKYSCYWLERQKLKDSNFTLVALVTENEKNQRFFVKGARSLRNLIEKSRQAERGIGSKVFYGLKAVGKYGVEHDLSQCFCKAPHSDLQASLFKNERNSFGQRHY